MARVVKIKKCTKCGKEYPATLDNFHKDLSKKDGLHSWCKNCKLEKDRTRLKNNYSENPEYFALKSNIRRERIKETLGVRLTTIHDYIRKLKPKPDLCPICCNNEKLELCSIGHRYTKNLEDWMYLCKSCHTVLDRTMSEKSVDEGELKADSRIETDSTPSNEECEHNRPFWECEICGNQRKPKEPPSDKIPASIKLWLDTFDYIATKKADLENMIFILKQKRQTTFANDMKEKYLKGDKKE